MPKDIHTTFDNYEITNIIYDTLMQNTQWPQLIINNIENQFVTPAMGKITFEYGGKRITIYISSESLE